MRTSYAIQLKIYVFILGLGILPGAKAQVSTYLFSQGNVTYTPITGGTVIGSSADDDSAYASLPIGFSFLFNDSSYTEFGVCSNGWILMGPGQPTRTVRSPISNGVEGNVIAAMCADLAAGLGVRGNRRNGSNIITNISDTTAFKVGDTVVGGLAGIPANAIITSSSNDTIILSANATSTGTAGNLFIRNGEMRYETIGTAPNRTLVMQFTRFRRASQANIELNFQIRLNETSNTIEVVYGNCRQLPANTSTSMLQVGLLGNYSSDVNNRQTTTDWSATIPGTDSSSFCVYDDTVRPANGLQFIWGPATCFAPPTVTISDVLTTTAELSWSTPKVAPLSYDWRIVPQGNHPDSGIVSSGVVMYPDSFASAAGLTPGTDYTAYLRSDCGAGDSSVFTKGVNFTTPCNPFTVPYFEDFETIITTDQSTTAPYCWRNELVSGSVTWRTDVDGVNNGIGAYSGNNAVYASWSSDAWLYTPGIILTAGTEYEFSFWYVKTDTNAATHNINVAYGKGATSGLMTTSLGTLTTAADTFYQKFTKRFIPATSGTYYFGVQAISNTSDTYYFVADDFSVVPAISCPPVVNIDSIVDISCAGTQSGSIYVSVTNGNAPYTYLWSNGSQSEDITALPAGAYTLTVTDANNCTATVTDTLNEALPILLTDSVAHVKCYGGEGAIYTNVTGGVAPYTYQWTNDDTTANVFDLQAGTYAVTVTDSAGCMLVSQSIQIVEPDSLSLMFTNRAVTCFGDSTGGIDLIIQGGTTPFNYVWSNGDTSEDTEDLPAGIYVATVTDANGCVAISDSIEISEPVLLQVIIDTVIHVKCFGDSTGSIYVSGNGGSLPYGFSWSNNLGIEDLINVAAGTYNVTLTDAMGCIASIAVTIIQPLDSIAPALDSLINVTCAGDSTGGVYISVSGGTLPYTYLWSNGYTGQDIAGVSAGIYMLTITDDNGCIFISPDIEITSPLPISLTVDSVNHVTCFGGLNGGVYITIAGGTAPYTYLWNNGDTTANLENISAGSYSASITDSKACVFSGPLQTINNGIAINVTTVVADATNGANGGINITVTGGTPPYQFNWSSGSTTEDITGLNQGVYRCTISDANDCFVVISDTVDRIDGIDGLAPGVSAIRLFPNPVQNQLKMEVEMVAPADFSFEIYNAAGQVIKAFSQVDAMAIQQTVSFDTEPAGLYMAKLKVGNEVITRRLLVVK